MNKITLSIKKYLFVLVTFGLLLGTGFSCSKVQKQPTANPISVSVLTIDSLNGIDYVQNYTGTIEEKFSSSLSFSNSGYINKIYVAEGDKVNKGQLLASLDKHTTENAYKSAKATLEQAQDGYQRLKQVYDQGGLAEVKWIEMLTNLAKAESMEKIAKKTLEDCDLYAPFAGVIGEKTVDAGMNVLPMQPILKIMDIDQVLVSFSVPENEIASIHTDQKVSVEVSATGNAKYNGKIVERGVVADPLSHSYTVKLLLHNEQHQLLPGMVCKVFVPKAENIKGFAIPSQTIQLGQDGHFVWMIKNGKTCRQKVQIGEFVQNKVLITSGLQQGDSVVTEGYLKICEGCDIVVRP